MPAIPAPQITTSAATRATMPASIPQSISVALRAPLHSFTSATYPLHVATTWCGTSREGRLRSDLPTGGTHASERGAGRAGAGSRADGAGGGTIIGGRAGTGAPDRGLREIGRAHV